jgi:hypothetical protein
MYKMVFTTISHTTQTGKDKVPGVSAQPGLTAPGLLSCYGMMFKEREGKELKL